MGKFKFDNAEGVDIQQMVVLVEYNNITEAEMARSILDNAHVWCMINNEFMSTIYPSGAFPAQLVVKREDEALAAELLELHPVG